MDNCVTARTIFGCNGSETLQPEETDGVSLTGSLPFD